MKYRKRDTIHKEMKDDIEKNIKDVRTHKSRKKERQKERDTTTDRKQKIHKK